MNTVLYHGKCHDGFIAACCAAFALKGDAEFWPCGYGKGIPEKAVIDDADVHLLDFSFPSDEIRHLLSRSRHFTWLDHHQTSRETALALATEFQGFRDASVDDSVVRIHVDDRMDVVHDLTRSGAGLACDLLCDEFRPAFARYAWSPTKRDNARLIVNHVQQRDLWKHKDPDALPQSDEFTAGLYMTWGHAYDDVAENWREFWNTVPTELIALGKIVLLSIESRITRALPHARWFVLHGLRCVCVNNTDVEITSDLGHRLLETHPDADVAVLYSLRNTGWSYSFRSSNGQARTLAEILGGGGHSNAAGANVVQGPPWVVGHEERLISGPVVPTV